MSDRTAIKVDTVTYDPKNDEYVLYFVENGPWPDAPAALQGLLGEIQNKVFDAMDAAIDGSVVRVYPDSLGKKVRIQVDSPGGCPAQLEELIVKIDNYINETKQYATAIESSPCITGLRVVTGRMMGRFERKSPSRGETSQEPS